MSGSTTSPGWHLKIASVRHGACRALRASALPRYRLSPVAIARLVDSPWDDTRAFAIALIRDELGTISADAIIAICDSIRPEVQALGKQLLHDRFQTADAGRYVVRLAEHPSTNLQLLVSGMLEHHVAGNLERLRALVPYLVTVQSQVNRGRVAKERVLALLRREASASAEVAALLAPVLDRQSATSAVTQKHPLIATMVDVRTAFPDVALPIAVTPPPPHTAAQKVIAGYRSVSLRRQLRRDPERRDRDVSGRYQPHERRRALPRPRRRAGSLGCL